MDGHNASGRVFPASETTRTLILQKLKSGLLHRHKRADEQSRNGTSSQPITSNGVSTNTTSKTEEILIGVLIPYTSKVVMSSYQTGTYYASSFKIAQDKINNDPKLLPGRKLRIIYNDTQCLGEKEIELFYYQLTQMKAAAVIGLGCDGCKTLARFAGALNVTLVSHVS